MKIVLIAAVDKNLGIGKDNKLLTHLFHDLKQFKKFTKGHAVLMGRKTYESIGKPLPNRLNLVLSSKKINIPGVKVVHSDMEIYREMFHSKHKVLFVIGGESLYKKWIDKADELYITHIDHEFEADTFFPKIQEDQWKIKYSEYNKLDAHNWVFKLYERK